MKINLLLALAKICGNENSTFRRDLLKVFMGKIYATNGHIAARITAYDFRETKLYVHVAGLKQPKDVKPNPVKAGLIMDVALPQTFEGEDLTKYDHTKIDKLRCPLKNGDYAVDVNIKLAYLKQAIKIAEETGWENITLRAGNYQDENLEAIIERTKQGINALAPVVIFRENDIGEDRDFIAIMPRASKSIHQNY